MQACITHDGWADNKHRLWEFISIEADFAIGRRTIAIYDAIPNLVAVTCDISTFGGSSTPARVEGGMRCYCSSGALVKSQNRCQSHQATRLFMTELPARVEVKGLHTIHLHCADLLTCFRNGVVCCKLAGDNSRTKAWQTST